MAAEVIGSIAYDLDLDDKDFKGKLGAAQKEAEGFSGALGNLGGFLSDVSKQSMILAGVVGGALALGIKSSVDAWKEQEQAIKQQEAVLRSTNNAAGVTVEQLDMVSSGLQKMTMFSDDAIMGAQNLLLTFTNIKGGNFHSATAAILDMSQALGQDLKSSTVQLGKALNDPIKGITALSRVGVSFTEQQKQQIETLVNSGKTMEAQRIILKELNTEFGGSALAAGKTFAGQLEILKNAFGELQESVGKTLIEAITPLVQGLNAFATNETVINWIDRLGNAFRSILEMFSGQDLTSELAEALGLETDSPIIKGIKTITETLRGFGEWIYQNKELVITFLKGLGVALGVLLIVGTITGLLMAFTNPLVLVAAGITALYTAYETNFLGIRDITNAVVDQLVAFFNDILMPAIQVLVQFISDRWLEISLITTGAWNIIKGIIQVAWSLIYGILATGLALLLGDWSKAWEHLKAAASIGWEGIKSIFTGVIQFIVGWGSAIVHNLVAPFNDAWKQISDIVNKIKDKLDFTKRHSPSVLDIVSRGVDLVNREFQSLGDMTLPSVSDALANNLQTSVQPANTQTIYMENHVHDRQDISAIGRELAFRQGIMK